MTVIVHELAPAGATGRVAYKLGEVAAMTGKSPKALRALWRKGAMPGKFLGRDLMVPASWVAEFGEWAPQEVAS